jgi:hypothetical protein
VSDLASIAVDTRALELAARQRQLEARELELNRRVRAFEAGDRGRRPRPTRIIFGTVVPRLPVDHF